MKDNLIPFDDVQFQITIDKINCRLDFLNHWIYQLMGRKDIIGIRKVAKMRIELADLNARRARLSQRVLKHVVPAAPKKKKKVAAPYADVAKQVNE